MLKLKEARKKVEEKKVEEEEEMDSQLYSELLQCDAGSCEGHMMEDDPWLNSVMHDLPKELSKDRACQVTLGLDVTDTPHTHTKLTLLLQLLASKETCQNISDHK